MHNKFDFIRSDWKTYKSKYKLNCNFCTEPLIRKIEEQIPREKKIEIKDYDKTTK